MKPKPAYTPTIAINTAKTMQKRNKVILSFDVSRLDVDFI
jgi:hypothetical protein